MKTWCWQSTFIVKYTCGCKSSWSLIFSCFRVFQSDGRRAGWVRGGWSKDEPWIAPHCASSRWGRSVLGGGSHLEDNYRLFLGKSMQKIYGIALWVTAPFHTNSTLCKLPCISYPLLFIAITSKSCLWEPFKYHCIRLPGAHFIIQSAYFASSLEYDYIPGPVIIKLPPPP